jgi:putative FmdB family regulatory protein
MPTYDYVCAACGHALEVFQSMSEPPKRKCPACGRNKLERRIGAGAGFLFKGSGFYLTDYRSKSYTEGQKAESKPADGAAPAAAAPAEAAPATAAPKPPVAAPKGDKPKPRTRGA